jgi:hypothetical protein
MRIAISDHVHAKLGQESSMLRRLMIVTFAIVGASVGGRAQPAPQLIFKVFFDGGNAYVQSALAPNQLTVGAVTQGDPPASFNHHRMRLEEEKGTWDPAATTLPPFEIPGSNVAFWDTFGWQIEVCPGGNCPTAGSLTMSPYKTSYGDCEDAPNNLALIPNFQRMHPSVVLRNDWKLMLDSQLLVREGKLRVDSAASCFDLKGPTSTTTMNVAGGPKEIIWELPVAAAYVELVLTPLRGGARRVIRLPADAAGPLPEVHLNIKTFQKYDNPVIGSALAHFQQFYSLYADGAIPPAERFQLIARQISRRATPGTECPPAFLPAP